MLKRQAYQCFSGAASLWVIDYSEQAVKLIFQQFDWIVKISASSE